MLFSLRFQPICYGATRDRKGQHKISLTEPMASTMRFPHSLLFFSIYKSFNLYCHQLLAFLKTMSRVIITIYCLLYLKLTTNVNMRIEITISKLQCTERRKTLIAQFYVHKWLHEL